MGQGRTLKRVYREIIASPFLPILLVGETIKKAVVTFTSVEPVYAYGILAVVFTILWALSDAVDVEFDREKFVGE